MSDIIITPNMNLPNPIPTVTLGPVWAQYIQSCNVIIDGHDHSLGKGVPITPNGLNISSDLSFLGNNATMLRSVRFIAQSGALNGATDLGCLYEAGVDLYYNDGAGNQIRITQSGAVTGATGTITGLPSGTASASYSAGTFTFQSATNVAANIDAGSYIFRNNTVGSHGVTVSAPNALAADYPITWPLLPAVKGIVTITSSGTMAAEPSVPAAASVVTVDTGGNLGTQPLEWDVSVGVGGTYSTWAAMNAAVADNTTVLALAQSFTEDVVFTKRIKVQGKGYGTIINGNVTFDTGSNDAIVLGVQVTGNVSFTAGVKEVTFKEFYVATNTVFTNDEGNLLEGMRL